MRLSNTMPRRALIGLAITTALLLGPPAALGQDPSTDPDALASRVLYSMDGSDEAGAALALVDLDADGLLDLLVGAPAASGGAGRVYVVPGWLLGLRRHG